MQSRYKGGFFSESAIPNLEKKIFQKTILHLTYKIPSQTKQYYVMGGNFKFQVQDSFFGIFFFKIWRSKKRIALSGKKPSLKFADLLITPSRKVIDLNAVPQVRIVVKGALNTFIVYTLH